MHAAFLPGVAEILVLLLMGGGLGGAVGVPPGPYDKTLAAVAPDDCLLYVTWTGRAAPDPESDNQLEQLLAEPQIQALAAELERASQRVVDQLRQRAGGRGGPPHMALESAPRLLELILNHPTAVMVSKFQVEGGRPNVEALLISRIGDAADQVGATLEALQAAAAPDAATTVRIGDAAFHQLRLGRGAPPITWGAHRPYLIIGIGDDAVQHGYERSQTPPPGWLTTLVDAVPVDRPSSVTYVNLARIWKELQQLGPPPELVAAVEASGLGGLASCGTVSGLDGEGFASRTLIQFQGEPTGLCSLFNAPPLRAADLQMIPRRTAVAAVKRVDLAEFAQRLIETVQQTDARAADQLRDTLQEARSELGFDLQQDVLAALGDVWRLYTMPDDGDFLTGWIAAVDVRDRDKLDKVNRRLIQLAEQAGGRRNPQIRRSEFQGQTIYSIRVPGEEFPFAPAWCLTENQLLAALFPSTIKAQLAAASEGSLADDPRVAAALDQQPIVLAYADARRLFRFFYPAVQLVASVAANKLAGKDLDIDVAALPSGDVIARHLTPSLMIVRRHPLGVEVHTRQVAGGGGAAAIGVGVGLALPAVQAAREAARRTQTMNRLKQIGLALHNYHDAYRAFPPAYSTDQEGKPLLSWRVHILPFLEQQRLYEQFHLDEPWDSPHNRTLIPQMPDVYRSPSAPAEPGKTHFLAVQGPGAVIGPPEEGQYGRQPPRGQSIATIVDGTANTVMVVESGRYETVTWTQPADYEYSEDIPAAGLLGLHPGGFLALLADGSVRFISGEVNPEMLRRLFCKNDGQPVLRP